MSDELSQEELDAMLSGGPAAVAHVQSETELPDAPFADGPVAPASSDRAPPTARLVRIDVE